MSVADKEKVWFIKLNKLGIGMYDRTKGEVASLASTDLESGDKIRILYRSKPTKLTTDLTASPDVPSQFHKGIMYRVMEQISARKGDYKGAQYYQLEYNKCVKMAKQYTNKGRDNTSYSISLHEY